MAEYIKREAAIKAVCDSSAHTCDLKNCFRGCQEAQAILAIPAADVAPVRHGCWIADKEDVEWGNHLIRYRCSECKERPHFDKEKYKFILSPCCPNCGAIMEGGGS